MVIVLLGMMFIVSIQPMFMIAMLTMIVLLYSYIMYMFMGGYWFSYILMLVMMSGMLVVFTYMASLNPNESFENYNLVYVMFMLITMFWVSYYYVLHDYKCGVVSINIWINMFGVYNIYIISFLLSVMLVVVWFSYLGKGALRIIW